MSVLNNEYDVDLNLGTLYRVEVLKWGFKGRSFQSESPYGPIGQWWDLQSIIEHLHSTTEIWKAVIDNVDPFLISHHIVLDEVEDYKEQLGCVYRANVFRVSEDGIAQPEKLGVINIYKQ